MGFDYLFIKLDHLDALTLKVLNFKQNSTLTVCIISVEQLQSIFSKAFISIPILFLFLQEPLCIVFLKLQFIFIHMMVQMVFIKQLAVLIFKDFYFALSFILIFKLTELRHSPFNLMLKMILNLYLSPAFFIQTLLLIFSRYYKNEYVVNL